MENEFRLGRSLLPLPDSDRRIGAETAGIALTAAISTAHGHITSHRLRLVHAAVNKALPRLLRAEIQGIEVENRLFHLGHINVRGLYLIDPSAKDIDLPFRRIIVEFDGYLRTINSPLSERARAALRKAWGVSRNGVLND